MSAIQKLLSDRPIAYYPSLARAVGGVAPALFLQQISHWQGGTDQWVYRTQEELEEELALSPKAQATCRKHLVDSGYLEEERRAKNRLHYRVCWHKVEAALKSLPMGETKPRFSVADRAGLDSPDGSFSLYESNNESIKEPSGNPDALPPHEPDKKEKTAKPKIEAPTQEEYLNRVERIRRSDPLGEDLYCLVQLAASENKTNTMRPSRAWNEFVLPFTQSRDEFPDEAWKVGLDAAINAGAGNLNYVRKVARKHQMAKGAEVFGIDGSSKPAQIKASPPELVEALESYEAKVGFFDLRRLADLAKRADLSQPEEQIPWPIRKQVSPDDRERGDVLGRVRKLYARLERGVS